MIMPIQYNSIILITLYNGLINNIIYVNNLIKLLLLSKLTKSTPIYLVTLTYITRKTSLLVY